MPGHPGVGRDEDASAPDCRVVAIGLKLGKAQVDQGAADAVGGSEGNGPQRRHSRSGGDERAKTGNDQQIDVGEQAQRLAHIYDGAGVDRGVLEGAGVGFVSEVTTAVSISMEKHRDVVVDEASVLEPSDNLIGNLNRRDETED